MEATTKVLKRTKSNLGTNETRASSTYRGES